MGRSSRSTSTQPHSYPHPPARTYPQSRRQLGTQEYRLRHNRFPSTSRKLAVASLPIISSTPASAGLLPFPAFFRGALLALRFRREKYATAIFLVRKRTPK